MSKDDIQTRLHADNGVAILTSNNDFGAGYALQNKQYECYFGILEQSVFLVYCQYKPETLMALLDVEIRTQDSEQAYRSEIGYTYLISEDFGFRLSATSANNVSLGVKKWF